jgi:branched-chain amino acid transport system ATP-binding protein
MTGPLLKVEELCAGYGEVPVLRDVALEIYEAEIVALVGSNGAGKTTLLRALSGILPWIGRATFGGASLQRVAPDAIFGRGLVQIPEGRQLFGRMTVQDNLLMGAYRRNDGRAIRDDLERVYTQFRRLKERRKQLAGTLSGGEQQMCAIARALMARPRLMMIDEMSLGLAPVVVERLMEVLTQVAKQGVTILLVEQDVRLALSTANRCYVLETGSVVRSGLAADLINDPELQRAYLGL